MDWTHVTGTLGALGWLLVGLRSYRERANSGSGELFGVNRLFAIVVFVICMAPWYTEVSIDSPVFLISTVLGMLSGLIVSIVSCTGAPPGHESGDRPPRSET